MRLTPEREHEMRLRALRQIDDWRLWRDVLAELDAVRAELALARERGDALVSAEDGDEWNIAVRDWQEFWGP